MRGRADAPEAERLILALLRDFARRARGLAAQADSYQAELTRLIRSLDPTLLEEPGIGPISAAKLIAGDPRRLKSEAAFARCNGTAPKPASSGQTIRHRLDRGGDRQANNALHTIALNRSIYDQRTRAYLEPAPARARPSARPCARFKRHLSPQPLQETDHDPVDFIEASGCVGHQQQ
jgi:transposase